MGPARRSLLFVMVFAVFGPAVSIRVQFFEEPNFKGYYKEITEVSEGCTNLPPSLPSFSGGSIQTDTCIIVFKDPDCKLYSAKVSKGGKNINSELYPNSYFLPFPDLDELNPKVPLGVRSFYPCNMTEGGPSLDIELSSGSNSVEFKNVCGCRNLPKELHKTLGLKANNHGNSFKVYTEQDCQGQSRYIPAGYNDVSQKINQLPYTPGKVPFMYFKSLGPSKTSHSYLDHCLQLTSTVFKFEFLDSSSEDEMIFEENVEMASKKVFRNNGSALITEVYQVKKTVKETVEISTAKSLSIVHKAKVDTNFETEGEANIPFVASGKFRTGIKLGYEFDRTATDSESKKTVVEESTEFTVSQTLHIQACTEYSLSSYIKMLKDKPVNYKVYSRISGTIGDTQMTAKELREIVGEHMQILSDYDEHTVVAAAKAVMKVNYGVNTFVNGQGSKIPGCMEK